MEIDCNICKREIEDDEYYECDGCTKTYHIKCDSVTKKEIATRQKSARSKLFCKICIKSTGNIQVKTLKQYWDLCKKLIFTLK